MHILINVLIIFCPLYPNHLALVGIHWRYSLETMKQADNLTRVRITPAGEAQGPQKLRRWASDLVRG